MQALKEWAVVCRALEDGRQSVLLRKGGILEFRQGFEVKHDRFLLFPTFEHQAREHLQPDYAGRLDAVLKEQPPDGTSILASYAEVKQVREVQDLTVLKKLGRYHVWSESYVNARLAYNPRKPMSVILVRVFKLDRPMTVNTREEWAGCRSWVPVDVSAGGGTPAINDNMFARISGEVMGALA